MDKKDKSEIVNYLEETTVLKSSSIANIYDEERAIRYREAKEKAREKAEEIESKGKYKGRDRKSFYFDDNALYRKVGEFKK